MDRKIEIRLSKLAEKQIHKIPQYIREYVIFWMDTVLEFGLIETRKNSGYHDEPLQGNRYGQRSIRLNRSYRMIYEENSNGQITLVVILEVNKHDY